jgi:hypothetical protein
MKIFIALALILWPAAIHPAMNIDCGGFENYGERAEFRKILKKHGLNYRVSVVWKDDRGWYFINDRGQRCPFR